MMIPKGTDGFGGAELELRKQAETFGSFPTEVRHGRICNSCFLSKVLYSCKTTSHAFLGRLNFYCSSAQLQRTESRRYMNVATAVSCAFPCGLILWVQYS